MHFDGVIGCIWASTRGVWVSEGSERGVSEVVWVLKGIWASTGGEGGGNSEKVGKI